MPVGEAFPARAFDCHCGALRVVVTVRRAEGVAEVKLMEIAL